MSLTSTPKKDGFSMPAEFEPHKKCWMLWPERLDIWHHEAKHAQVAFAAVANAIAQYEGIAVGVSPEHIEEATKLLKSTVEIVELPHDDAWARDVGPTFVKGHRNQIRGVNWVFNAWGGIEEGAYYPWDQDDLVASRILELEKIESYRTEGFVLEGGSIHVDGEGTLITTKECLLNKNRNPHLKQEEIETYLMDYLNVEKIIWLDQGLYNDETDGHVDNICCFARPGEVILAWCEDEKNPNYDICRAAYEKLENCVDAKGRVLSIHKLVLPAPVFISKEEYESLHENPTTRRAGPNDVLAASYVNFLFVNNGIILPVFDDEQDNIAINQLQEIFPEREIVPIHSREILLGGGNIHCITQQQPK